jgi:hypothetical protein
MFHLSKGFIMRLMIATFLLFIGLSMPAGAPLQAQTPQPPTEDNLTADEFSSILKEAWVFLNDETDSLLKRIEKKGEFETSSEFERRVADMRQRYVASTQRFQREKKFHERVFGVLLKASLGSYDADKGVYLVGCDTSIQAPYNIPTLKTVVPRNPYVGLADTITGGYRVSVIYLKFRPAFRWQVPRDAARIAKVEEGELFFKIRFRVNAGQETFRKEAYLTIIPAHIMLLDRKTNTVHWEQKLM